MIFYSNLVIFYHANPHVGGKLTSFVAGLAQNTCVYGCRLVLYHLNFNISSWERFTKTGREIIGGFLSKFAIFYKANPRFWGKPTNYVAVLAQNTCVCGCRLALNHLNFNISSYVRKVHEDWEGNHRCFSLQIYHLLQSKSTFLRKTDQFCC